MCRSIKKLLSTDQESGEQEVRAAVWQFVRKVSGSRKPSKQKMTVFEEAVSAITADTMLFLKNLVKDRVKPL